MGDESPKTPTKVERIPRDDSFKTCKADLPSPKSRRRLRMTPARTSILSGGKPYKEVTSSNKKFNSRTRPKTPGSRKKGGNETTGSNETFIRCEQDLLFDRDSLEVGGQHSHKYSSTPKSMKDLEQVAEQFQEVTLEPLTKQPTFLKDKNHNVQDDNNVAVVVVAAATAAKNASPLKVKPTEIIKPAQPSPKRRSPKKILSSIKLATQTKRSPQKKKLQRKSASPKKTFQMPAPPPPQVSRPSNAISRRQLFTPITSFRKPTNLKSTASRYLSQWNNSRITRAQSFKSTAELERDYFRSLRSF